MIERIRTRDLLLEYDYNVLPPRPRTAGLSIVYPWESMDYSLLSRQIYQIALNNGFSGTEKAFWSKFSRGAIIRGLLRNFPVPGNEDNLYLDEDTGILYYFKTFSAPINLDVIEQIGAEVVGTQEELSYVYIPVRAMLIEDTILDGGTAAEYID